MNGLKHGQAQGTGEGNSCCFGMRRNENRRENSSKNRESKSRTKTRERNHVQKLVKEITYKNS